MKRMLSLVAMTAMTTLCSFCPSALAETTPEIAKGNCKACAEMCEKTTEYCNQKKGKYGSDNVTNALKDCIDACKAGEGFLGRNSVLSGKVCAVTVEACNQCAKVCDGFAGDINMAACANECRKAVGNLQKIK